MRALRIPLALASAFVSWLRIAWWGAIAPRTPLESEPLRLVQAVILGPRGVLLGVRSDLRGWELPGGTIESGEAPEDALRREVREETGLVVEIESLVGEWVRTGFRPHTLRVYRCRPVVDGPARAQDANARAAAHGAALAAADAESRLVPGEEVLELAWHDPSDVPDTLFPWYRDALRRALAGAEAPSAPIREHWGWAAIAAGMRIDLRMRMR